MCFRIHSIGITIRRLSIRWKFRINDYQRFPELGIAVTDCDCHQNFDDTFFTSESKFFKTKNEESRWKSENKQKSFLFQDFYSSIVHEWQFISITNDLALLLRLCLLIFSGMTAMSDYVCLFVFFFLIEKHSVDSPCQKRAVASLVLLDFHKLSKGRA